jgi:hypothetical protein
MAIKHEKILGSLPTVHGVYAYSERINFVRQSLKIKWDELEEGAVPVEDVGSCEVEERGGPLLPGHHQQIQPPVKAARSL